MVWIIIGSILGFLLLVIFILSIIAYRLVFYSPIKGQNNDYNKVKNVNYNGISGKANDLVNKLLTLPCEDLYIKSYDGLQLHAYFYKSEGSNQYVVFFHGYRRTARRNFCGLTLDLLKENVNVILVDMRAHGESEGHQTTFGKKEQYDVVSWTNYALERFGRDIKLTVSGVSLGAASVLMAADKLDENVKIVADSPYYSIEDIFKKTIRYYKLSPAFFYPLAVFTALFFCHMNLKSNVPLAINKSKNKILIIHSTSDTVVSYKLSEKICLDNKDHMELALFDDVEHGFAYLRQTEKYREIYIPFVSKK